MTAPVLYDPRICIDFETAIGEGPVWDEARQLLWFVDIPAQSVLALDPAKGRTTRFEMPDFVTSIGLMPDDSLLVSLRTGVWIFHPATGRIELLCNPEPDRPMNRLNDGKVGPDGCFWVGSMFAEQPTEPTGALYRIAPDGSFTQVFDGLHVSNGLAWSPDHHRLYHADSLGSYIKSYAFDPLTGAVGAGFDLSRPSREDGLPDGAAVDLDGNYWSAGITAGCLNIHAPSGALLLRHDAGQRWPTMPCFGGADGSTLYVTGLSRNGDRGTLTSFRTESRGTAIARFGAPLVS